MNKIRRLGFALTLASVSVSMGVGAQEIAAPAAPRGRGVTTARPQRPALKSEVLDKLRGLLADADPATIAAAAQALGDSGAPNAALPLIEMLSLGAPPAAAVVAIDALKRLRDPAAVEVLALYAGHRDPEPRRHAVEALGVFADARVVPVLMDRLGDTVAAIRTAAAEALATRAERAATPRMMALLKRNDAAVAGPLGMLASVTMVGEILELQGAISDDNLAVVLGEMLKRRDVTEPAKLELIKSLAGVNGAASTTALVEYVGGVPGGDKRGSKLAAQKVLDQRGNLR